MEDIEVVLELMSDMIEKMLSKREYQVYVMSKNMKPRYIAKELGLAPKTICNIRKRVEHKINRHQTWLKSKIDERGL